MTLKLTDLAGKMAQVEIVDYSQSEKDGNQIVVLKCSYNDKLYDLGLFGSSTIENVLEQHGTTEDGKHLLMIPESKLHEGMVWINNPY